MIKITVFKKFLAPFLFSLFLTSCATQPSAHKHHRTHNNSDSSQYLGKENAVTQMSKKGLYNISLYNPQSSIPLRKIHDWNVHITTLDGKPVENAKIYVFGGMPMHRHDFPTVLKVKEHLGGGSYRVEGVKFSMHGHWEMRFTIKQDNSEDRVIFGIDL